MFLNNFSVRVSEGTELAGGYVELDHDTQYSLILKNNYHGRRCDAEVTIDGKHIGTWRIEARGGMWIERPAHDTGRLTFYKSGSKDARKAGLDEVEVDKLGLIEVVFTPEIAWTYVAYNTSLGENVEPSTSPPYQGVSYDDNSSTAGPLRPEQVIASYTVSNSTRKGSLSSGGTGLSGKSNQNFSNAQSIQYDYSAQTTINLRLVTRSHGDEPRPLTQFANPVPPVVNG